MLTVNWNNPPLKSDNVTPSDPNNTVSIAIAPAPAAGASPAFTVLGVAAAGVVTFSEANPNPGNYILQLTVVDGNGKAGAPVVTPSFNVPVPAPILPGSVSNVTVTVTP